MDSTIPRRIYMIDAQNDIATEVETSEPGVGVLRFGSEEELKMLVADWPSSRLLDIWNRLPGKVRVTKFTNRRTAVRRIWKAVNSRNADSATLLQDTRPKHPKAKGEVAAASRMPTKGEAVIALMHQPGGATLKVLMEATGWQAHSVRGFISGHLAKKLRLKVKSVKRDGERVYTIRS